MVFIKKILGLLILLPLTLGQLFSDDTKTFTIENNTKNRVYLVSCCGGNKVEIGTPCTDKKKSCKKKSAEVKSNIFKVNKAVQENYDPPKEMLFATRFKYVNKDDEFKIEVHERGFKGSSIGHGFRQDKIYTYVISMDDIEEGSVFKIGSLYPGLVGFQVVSCKIKKQSF